MGGYRRCTGGPMPFVERLVSSWSSSARPARAADLSRAGFPPFRSRELRLVGSSRSTVRPRIGGGSRGGRPDGSGPDGPCWTAPASTFFATPPEVTRALAPTVGEMVPAVIDVGSSLAMRLWVPFAGTRTVGEIAQRGPDHRLTTPPPRRHRRSSDPSSRFRRERVPRDRLVSAGSAGKAGIEELSQQVIAMFNSRRPPGRLSHGARVRPPAPARRSGPTWPPSESRIVAEVAAAVGLAPEQILVTVLGVPRSAGSAWMRRDRPASRPRRHRASSKACRRSSSAAHSGSKRLVGKSRLRVGRLGPIGRRRPLSRWATLQFGRPGRSDCAAAGDRASSTAS